MVRRFGWIGLVAILVGCATQPVPAISSLPGFFSGLLHGFLILFSLIASLIVDVRIYAFPNSGWWYDFGYFLGVGVWCGAFATRPR